MIAAVFFALSACDSPAEPEPGSPLASLQENQLFGDLNAYRAVSSNGPTFGSITQSSNGNGVSTDRVETTLNRNGDLTVVVRNGSGAVSLLLGSREDEFEDLNGTVWMDSEELPPGWDGNGWILAKQDGEDVIVSFAYAAWDTDDAANYLAGGYWTKSNETQGVTELGTFGDAGIGSIFAYYDGQASSWTRPATGTVTYLGTAEGAYVGPDGDAGVWWSTVMLVADFSTGSISGCIGCESGIYTYSTVEDLKNDRWTQEDLHVVLDGDGSLRNDGSFESTLSVFESGAGTSIGSMGRWGGLFSQNANSASMPVQAAGTIAGTAGGYGFVGVFHGGR